MIQRKIAPMTASRALGLLPPVLAAAALILLLASGPGHRLGLWDYRVALSVLRAAAYVGFAAAGASLLFLLVARLRRSGWKLFVAAFVAGACAAAVPLQFQRQARAVPPINDISTDTADPPRFLEGRPYAGAETAARQREAYPDLQPAVLALPQQAAFEKALAAARAQGWEIVRADPAGGRIEATATTPWFGFKDDVAIRVLPAGTTGSRVDVRSKSRVGRGDAGANAARIRRFLAAVK